MNTHNGDLEQLYDADLKANITSVKLKLNAVNPFERRKPYSKKVEVGTHVLKSHLDPEIVIYLNRNYGKKVLFCLF